MDISLFFTPVDEHIVESFEYDDRHVVNSISVNIDGKIDWKSSDIVFFTVGIDDPHSFREVFYNLKQGGAQYSVADLGHLNDGKTEEDTRERLTEVCDSLLQEKKIVIVIGALKDFDYALFSGYYYLSRAVTFLNVDSHLDLGEYDDNSGLEKVIRNEDGHLSEYIHLGHQGYFISEEGVDLLESISHTSLRLGKVRGNITSTEPLLRMSDLAYVNMRSVKQVDFPSNGNVHPFGLTGEEMCQLAWYAGNADNLSTFGINTVQDLSDPMAAHVVAIMMWYFIEGVYKRVDTHDFESENYTQYKIAFDDLGTELEFYKSIRTGKWWLRVGEKQVIPCGYEDYEVASTGELPDRWLSSKLGK